MDALTATFSALADPTRRAMLTRLGQGPATVNQLAEPFPLSLPTVSRHLKVLEAAGLVSKSREAQFRTCKLEPERLVEAIGWMATCRSFFDTRFDRLEAQLASRADAAHDEGNQ